MERLRYSYEIDRLDYVAGKPNFVGATPPPPPPAPRGSDGRPLYDDSKPFEDRVLNKAIVSSLQAAEVATRLRAEGYEPIGSTPGEMAASMAAESATWSRVIKAAGIRAD